MGLRYRFRQFWQGIRAAPLSGSEAEVVRRQLSPAEWSLFQTFTANDQVHSYRVWRTLQEAGQSHPALLKAALLHDIGKTRLRLTVWERSLVVAGQALFPSRVLAWGSCSLATASFWQRPFIAWHQHPAWSAEMLAEAGSDRLTILLVRQHQTQLEAAAFSDHQEGNDLLTWLQWADNQN